MTALMADLYVNQGFDNLSASRGITQRFAEVRSQSPRNRSDARLSCRKALNITYEEFHNLLGYCVGTWARNFYRQRIYRNSGHREFHLWLRRRPAKS